MKISKWIRGAASMIFLGAGFCSAQSAPSNYQDLFSSLQNGLSSFNNQIMGSWDGTLSPVVFAGGLITANSNAGGSLLVASRITGVQAELDRLKATGARAVTVNISFPLFYRPFFDFNGTPGQYDQFLAFYKSVANEVHNRGMLLIVESGVLFPGFYSQGSGFNLSGYYSSLSLPQYSAGRAAAAAAIAAALQPDYMSIGSEPDNEAVLVGQASINTPSGFASQEKQIIQQIRAGGSQVPVGAGVGTWMSNGGAFIGALAGTGVNYIDLHIYPINFGFLQNAAAYADQAAALGLPVATSEAWLLKERDSEFSQYATATDPTIFARDTFSFWAPLDQQFLDVMTRFANWKRERFFSAFWTKYFWAYLDYNQVASQPATQVIDLSNQTSANALLSGGTTSTASEYLRAITPPVADNLGAVVSTASFKTTALGPASIATIFGANLSSSVATAQVVPLSTNLGGGSVGVIDSSGVEHPAALYFVSPNQINFVVPPEVPPGWAKVVAHGPGGRVEGNVHLASVAPAVFTAGASGNGVAAAIFSLMHADGTRSDITVANCAATCTPVPLSLGSSTDQAYLTLYGSGIRGRSSLSNVVVNIAGRTLVPIYAGVQPTYPGMDQVNIPLPSSLAGSGVVDVSLVVDGIAANTVNVQFQ